MITKVNALAISAHGVDAASVEVEVRDGLGIHIIGLPDDAAKELLLRVVTVLQQQGITVPGKKIVIDVTAWHYREMRWTLFDLPVYIALRAAIRNETIDAKAWYCGALNLDGSLAEGECIDAAAANKIVGDGYLVCPFGSFPRNVMIKSTEAIKGDF